MGTILEIAGFVIGLLYLWWEYHANSKLWLASLIMPAISMWIYFSKGLYADFGINIYYLLIAIYGYWVWTHGGRHNKSADSGSAVPITHIPFRILAGASGVFVAVWCAIYLILTNFTNSTVPLCDSFTTALSIVAMWLLAKKYVEQWIAWVVVDIVCVGLYIYKGIYFYATLYAVYSVVACFGYRKWLRLMHEK